jgi:hypothetical protein
MMATLGPCFRCGHPPDWHRHDDADNVPPTNLPMCKFRCLGYDCEAPGPLVLNGCDCPDYLRAATPEDGG